MWPDPSPSESVCPSRGPRIGILGALGSGNLGNDGSFEAVLAFLRAEHPNASVACLCDGPERVTAQYGIPASRLYWNHAPNRRAAQGLVSRGFGKLLDTVRTVAWVRRFDFVLVPGMGVLEESLPLRPWGFPYALFLACLSGRLFRTRTVLVSVGADTIRKLSNRWLLTRAARLAHYRSYRDEYSKHAMQRMGIDTRYDGVFPDLAYALPVPPANCGRAKTVGLGLMAYDGDNGDIRLAGEIYHSYLAKVKYFARWLVDHGYHIRLLVGDQVDEEVVTEIMGELQSSRPGASAALLTAEPVSSLAELMQQMSAVDMVVATRYHNLVCALKLSKPTLSVGYAAKSEALMGEMGLGRFCQRAVSLDVDRLLAQLSEVESEYTEVQNVIAERNEINEERIRALFATLSALIRS